MCSECGAECGAECGLAHARRVWETARPKPTSPWSCVAPLSPPYSGTGFIYPPSFSHALDSGSDPRRRPAPAVRTDGGSGVVGRSQQHRRVLVRWSDLRADDVRPCVSRPSDIVQSPSTSFRSHLHLRFRYRFRFPFRYTKGWRHVVLPKLQEGEAHLELEMARPRLLLLEHR